MIESNAPGRPDDALSARAIRLRDQCLVTLSRRASRRPPSVNELAKIRDNLGLHDAWQWWSHLDAPTVAVRAASVPRTPRLPRREWRRMAIALLTTGAWVIVPVASAFALAGPLG